MCLLMGRWLTVLENVGGGGEGRGKAGCGAKWGASQQRVEGVVRM